MTFPFVHFMSKWNFRAEQVLGLNFLQPGTLGRDTCLLRQRTEGHSKIPVTLRIPTMIEFLYDESQISQLNFPLTGNVYPHRLD